MSGHNKWSKIKHQKEKQDKKKGKLFSKLVREIQIAARKDPDPKTNPDLQAAIKRAKDENMPSENIERALQRVKDQKEKGNLDKIVLEAFGPKGAALIIEALTDNKNRTISKVRHAVNSNRGELAEKGSTKWMFERKAALKIDKSKWSEKLQLALIDHQLEDIKEKEDSVVLITSVKNYSSLQNYLKKEGITIEDAETIWIPKNPKKEKETEKLQTLITQLKENPDVESVYTNLADHQY